MANKTRMTMEIEVIGRDGAKKGHLELTSGNINFYRANAKTLTAQYTYQQLISLIEENIEENEDEEDEGGQPQERRKPLVKEVSPDFPKIQKSSFKSVSAIEIDIDNVPAQYQNGVADELVRLQIALWVKDNQFSGIGTIWAKGISSVNFQRQGYSVFYCLIGMPGKCRDYLADSLYRKMPGCIKKNSNFVTPKEGDWRISCQVQYGNVWFEEEQCMWKEILV